jgi:hypothetical protein
MEFDMAHLEKKDLFSLEKYAEIRDEFRKQVMQHKKNRRLALNPHAVLYFEDILTMKYQIQEMLRIEKIFEAEGIQEELDVYNPLIPDGSNWKATFMIEYTNVNERKKALAKLIGIEKTFWVRVDDSEKVFAISNEDLTRDNNEKTASVHFMRFELTKNMHAQAKVGLPIYFGIDHPLFKTEVVVPPEIQKSLVQDLD